MTDRIYERFLRGQYGDGMALAEESDLLSLIPNDCDPPTAYIAVIEAKGLALDEGGQVVEVERADFYINLHRDYLRRVDPGQIVKYLGPERRPWHPNIMAPWVCVSLTPGTPLVDLLYTVFELWTWNLFGVRDDGLNHAAAQWARAQDPARFPVDRRPLKRRAHRFSVNVTEPADPHPEETP